MKRKLMFLCLLTIYPPLISGQTGYYIRDTKMVSGAELIDNGHAANDSICQVKLNNRIITYAPGDVSEYGLKDGRVYVAHDIRPGGGERKVFMERLGKGKLIVYYYKGPGETCFFLEDRGQLIKIPKKDTADRDKGFREILSPWLGDCESVSDQLKYLAYNRTSFHRFVYHYNNCLHKPFPHVQYGLVAGYGISRITIPAYLVNSSTTSVNLDQLSRKVDFEYDGSPALGLFIDVPVLTSEISLYTEGVFCRNTYVYHHQTTSELELLVKTISLNVPVMLRYTLPYNRYRPYANAGALYSLNMNTESHSANGDQRIENNQPDEELVPLKHQVGFVAGCGLQAYLTPKHALTLEIRYLKTFSVSSQESFIVSGFLLLTSFNF